MELTERLRNDALDPLITNYMDESVLISAADELERLQSKVELLESKLQEIVKNSRSPESIRLKVPSQTKGE